MTNKLNCAHLNVRSLVKNFITFKDILLINDFDLIAISETWLSDCISSDAVHIEGYIFVRCDRITRAGGVAFYIKSHLSYCIVETDNQIEQLWLLISLNSCKYAFGVVYNPHRSRYTNFINSLETTLSTILSITSDIFCFGDFNIDMLDVTSSATAYTVEFFQSFGLTQLINEPTRITSESTTLIDYIITSNVNLVCSSSVVCVHELFDHHLIRCTVDIPQHKRHPVIRTYRNFKNFNFNQFESDLRSIPWNNIYHFNAVDDKVQFLSENLIILLDIHAPVCRSRITKPYAPWLTDTIKQMMRLRDRALSQFKRNNNSAHFNYYKQLRNQVTAAVRREKKAFYTHIFKQNSRMFWRDLKTLNISGRATTTELPPHLNNPDEMNVHFINSIPKVDTDNNTLATFYKNHRKNSVESILKFKCVDEIEVLKIISSIKTKAKGIDGLNISIIELCVPFLLPYITHIINYCITKSVFPSEWKRARILPLPKTSEVKDMKDLRPISILPTLSKIIERVIEQQLRAHLDSNQVIPITQSGYKKGHSCTTALLHITDDIISATDRGKITLLVLLDYSKAFDTIDHQILLSILHYIGLGPEAIALMTDYLSNRHQAVSLNDHISNFCRITSGVPQGSILGPILFSIYISTFPSVFRTCQTHFYADDSQLYVSFEPHQIANVCHSVNHDLQQLVDISQKHALKLNPDKSKVMLFGRKNDIHFAKDKIDVRLGDSKLSVVDSAKSLGLTLDSSLRFNKHISKCLQNGYCNLRMIFHNRHIFDQHIKTLLCNTLVLSKVDFCDSVFSSCLDYRNTVRLQKLQNSCLRLIFGIRKYERISHKLKDIAWLNMTNRRILHCTYLYHKILHTQMPPYLYNKITFRTDVHNLNLRFRGNISIPLHSSEFGKRGFVYCIASNYNKLPLELKAMSLINFKKQFKMLLLNSQNGQ